VYSTLQYTVYYNTAKTFYGGITITSQHKAMYDTKPTDCEFPLQS